MLIGRIAFEARRGRWPLGAGCLLIIALASGAAAQSAPQAPATVTIQPRWQAGAVLRWQVRIHSSLTRTAPQATESASLDNQTLAQMKVESVDAGGAVADLSVVSYKTQVSGLSALAEQLRASEDRLAAAAPALAPVRIRLVAGGENQVLSAPSGDEYSEIEDMLEQLARTDSLPLGATRVGDHWTRQRVQNLATLHFALPTALRCSLARLDWTGQGWQAVIAVNSDADADLPPSSIPNFSEFAKHGYAPKAHLSVSGTATARYAVATGMLDGADSQTHNLLRIDLVGPEPKPIEILTRIDSTGSVRRLTPE